MAGVTPGGGKLGDVSSGSSTPVAAAAVARQTAAAAATPPAIPHTSGAHWILVSAGGEGSRSPPPLVSGRVAAGAATGRGAAAGRHQPPPTESRSWEGAPPRQCDEQPHLHPRALHSQPSVRHSRRQGILASGQQNQRHGIVGHRLLEPPLVGHSSRPGKALAAAFFVGPPGVAPAITRDAVATGGSGRGRGGHHAATHAATLMAGAPSDRAFEQAAIGTTAATTATPKVARTRVTMAAVAGEGGGWAIRAALTTVLVAVAATRKGGVRRGMVSMMLGQLEPTSASMTAPVEASDGVEGLRRVLGRGGGGR